MSSRFLNNITINDEYTLPTADGSANQVIATNGNGVLTFVNQSSALSGGEANKVAVWSATDTLTHNDNFHFDTTNVRLGIGDSNPNRTLVVSETRTGSTASDAYTAIVKSVQSSGASPNPGTGGLKVQYTSSSSNVHAFGLVAGSSSSDFLTTGPMHFYTNSDLDTVSATGFAMQLDSSQRLTLGSMTASQKLNVNGNVTADRYYGNGTTVYYLDPNDTTTSAYVAGPVRIRQSSSYQSTALEVTAATGTTGDDGIFIKNYWAGGPPTVSSKNPFLSIGCADSNGHKSTIYLGEDASPANQESKIEYAHDSADLRISVKGQGNYREHVRFGDAGSTTARTQFTGNVGIGTTPSAALHVSGVSRATSGFSTDGNNRFYTWRALNNTSNSSNQYYRIARVTGGQSTRFIIELAGRSTSYTDGVLPAFGKIVGQLNNDNNFDIVYYNASATDEVVDEVGQVDVSTVATDIYVRVGNYAELTAIGHISDGTITTYDSNSGSTSAPTGYVQATEYKLWNTGNDGASSGLDADLLDGQHGSHYLNYNNLTNTPTIPTDFVSKANGGTFSGNVDIGSYHSLDNNGNFVLGDPAGIQSGISLRCDTSDITVETSAGLTVASFGGGGNVFTGSVKSPIYYDSDNTSFYFQPESTSGTSWRLQTPTGYVQIGSRNTSYVHFYTDRGQYYFNKGVTVDTGAIRSYNEDLNLNRAGSTTARIRITSGVTHSDQYFQATGSLRAPSFIDSGNTSYYVAPGGTSVLSRIVAGTTSTSNYGSSLHVTGTGTSTAPYVHFNGSNSGYSAVGVRFNNLAYGYGAEFIRTGYYDATAIRFVYSTSQTGQVGSISIGTSSTSYNTTSDYRLKENVIELTGGIERVKQLQPKRFNFINDDNTVDGFIAHEAKGVVPEAVTGEKDEVLPNGDPVYQGIDQAKLVPLLTAALKEAIAKIEDLETRVQSLEN